MNVTYHFVLPRITVNVNRAGMGDRVIELRPGNNLGNDSHHLGVTLTDLGMTGNQRSFNVILV